MARFYFHLDECGTVTEDHEGAELLDLVAVREHAIRAARSVMAAELMNGRLCLGCQLNVVNDAGDVVFMLPFREAVKVSGI